MEEQDARIVKLKDKNKGIDCRFSLQRKYQKKLTEKQNKGNKKFITILEQNISKKILHIKYSSQETKVTKQKKQTKYNQANMKKPA